MPNPTPDGRDWLTPREIIRSQLEAVFRNHPNVSRNQMEALRDSLVEGFRDTGYGVEFKILRLTEKIRTAINAGVFGPLTIPNTVDVEGNPIRTPVGEIAALFDDVYSEDFLNNVDDNGNPL